jgi:hypothetical protein
VGLFDGPFQIATPVLGYIWTVGLFNGPLQVARPVLGFIWTVAKKKLFHPDRPLNKFGQYIS